MIKFWTAGFLIAILICSLSEAKELKCKDEEKAALNFYKRCKTQYIINTGKVGEKGHAWCKCISDTFRVDKIADEKCEFKEEDVSAIVLTPGETHKKYCGLNGIPYTKGNQ